jgi:hypothetical protein
VEEFGPLVDRAGWTVDAAWAIYRPLAGGWFAKIRLVAVQGHAYSRWRIAFGDASERRHYTQQVNGLGEVIRSPRA